MSALSPRASWKCLHALSLLFFFLSLHSGSKAQVIGRWTFNNTIDGIPGTFNSVSQGDFSSVIASTAFNGGMEYFGHNGWPTGAMDPGAYLQFSLTPNSGYALNISELRIRIRHSNTGSNGGSGPKAFSVRSSLDNYASDIYSGAVVAAYVTHNIDPGAAFSYLTSAVHFRIYGYNSVLYSGGNNRLVFDNIDVNSLGAVLSVNKAELKASLRNSLPELNYEITSGADISRVLIERALNNEDFQSLSNLGRVEPGNSFTGKFTDQNAPATATHIRYRLKLIHADNAITYSSPALLKFPAQSPTLKLSTSGHSLFLTGVERGKGEIIFFDRSGRVLFRKIIESQARDARILIQIPGFITTGLYYLRLLTTTQIETSTVLIQ